MNELTILLTLAITHFIALMSPGPDFALIVQNTNHYGRRTGLMIALGLSTGILIHSLLSITGVSYLIKSHPILFFIVKIIGSSYLIWLGLQALISVYQQWRAKDSDQAQNHASKKRSRLISHHSKAFSKGLMTNLLNPKALVFFVVLMASLVPTDMSITGKSIAVFILWSLALFWFALLAWVLSTSRVQKLLNAASIYIDLLCGAVFISIGGIIFIQSVINLYPTQ